MKRSTSFTFAFILCIAAIYTPRLFAQVANAYCSTGETLIETALEFRRTGHPVDHAMQITRSISNPQARQFIQLSIRDLFRNPGPTERMLRNGQWKEMCIHFVRTGDLSTYRPSPNSQSRNSQQERNDPPQDQNDEDLLDQTPADRSFTIPFPGGTTQQSRRYVAGGDVEIDDSRTFDSVGNSCNGFVAQTPDHFLNVESSIERITIWTKSAGDTTLLLAKRAEGMLFCDDDSGNGNNELLEIELPKGKYGIWVGTYHPNQEFEYELHVSHSPSQ